MWATAASAATATGRSVRVMRERASSAQRAASGERGGERKQTRTEAEPRPVGVQANPHAVQQHARERSRERGQVRGALCGLPTQRR